MRVLSRRLDQTIAIGTQVKVTVAAVRGNRVRLAIQAPPGMLICRQEVVEELSGAAQEALAATRAEPTQPALPDQRMDPT